MNKRTKASAAICAFLAAVFYAISTPFSKVILNNVAPTFMVAGTVFVVLDEFKKTESI